MQHDASLSGNKFIIDAAPNHSQIPLFITQRFCRAAADLQCSGQNIDDLEGLADAGYLGIQMFLCQKSDREINSLHKTSI